VDELQAISMNDLEFNFDAITQATFLKCSGEELSFIICDANQCNYSLTAENLGAVLQKCPSIVDLYFLGSIPENLKINGEYAQELQSVTFRNLNFIEFCSDEYFIGDFGDLGIIFEKCPNLSKATFTSNEFADVNFINCDKFCTLCIGTAPYVNQDSSSCVLLGGESSYWDVVVTVKDCNLFNQSDSICMEGFQLTDSYITMGVETPLFGKVYTKDDITIQNTMKITNGRRVPNHFLNVSHAYFHAVGVLKKFTSKLPEGFSVTDTAVIYSRDSSEIVLNFDLPKETTIAGGKVGIDHVTLRNIDAVANGSKVCSIDYDPSEDSIIEIQNFACHRDSRLDRKVFFRREDTAAEINLPGIRLNGEMQSVLWVVDDSKKQSFPILQEFAGDATRTHGGRVLEEKTTHRWPSGYSVHLIPSWLVPRSAGLGKPAVLKTPC
jgi:hypothetical protein